MVFSPTADRCGTSVRLWNGVVRLELGLVNRLPVLFVVTVGGADLIHYFLGWSGYGLFAVNTIILY